MFIAATACATKHPNTLPKYDTISRSDLGITMHVDGNIKICPVGCGATSTALTQALKWTACLHISPLRTISLNRFLLYPPAHTAIKILTRYFLRKRSTGQKLTLLDVACTPDTGKGVNFTSPATNKSVQGTRGCGTWLHGQVHGLRIGGVRGKSLSCPAKAACLAVFHSDSH